MGHCAGQFFCQTRRNISHRITAGDKPAIHDRLMVDRQRIAFFTKTQAKAVLPADVRAAIKVISDPGRNPDRFRQNIAPPLWMCRTALAQDVGIYIVHRSPCILQRLHRLGMFIIKGHRIAGRKGIRRRGARAGICVFSHLRRHVRAQRKNRMRSEYSTVGSPAYILLVQIGQGLITTVKTCLHPKVGHPLAPQLTGMRIQQLAQLVNRHNTSVNLLTNDISKR